MGWAVAMISCSLALLDGTTAIGKKQAKGGVSRWGYLQNRDGRSQVWGRERKEGDNFDVRLCCFLRRLCRGDAVIIDFEGEPLCRRRLVCM
jgi:hypothetical protein